MREKRCLRHFLAAAGFALPASAQVQARQGSFEVPLIPIVDTRTIAAYYAYGVVSPSSASTGLETAETSLLFLYQELMPSLVVIHDIPNDATGGSAVFDFGGLPPGTTIAVSDEPGECCAPDPPAAGRTTATWNWSPCCTDGAALSLPDDPPPYCISVAPSFASGIGAWQLLSGATVPPTRFDLPSLTDTVYLCSSCTTLGCPPVVDAACGVVAQVVASGASLCGSATVVNDFNGGGADASGVYPPGTTVVTFTLTDAAGFTATCQSQVVVTGGPDPIPPDQGNVLRAAKRNPDVAFDFTGALATRWRMYRDPDKLSLGTTPVAPDAATPSWVDAGALLRAPSDYYRVKGLSPCSLTPGP